MKANEPIAQPGIFHAPSNPLTLDEVLDIDNPEEVDDEIDLEQLFYPSQPVKITPQPEIPQPLAKNQPQDKIIEPDALEKPDLDQIDLRPLPLPAGQSDENSQNIDD